MSSWVVPMEFTLDSNVRHVLLGGGVPTDTIEGRGTLISFDELHEKLINKEHCGAPWVVCPEDKLFATGQGLTQVDKFRLFDMDPLLYLG